MAKIQVILLEDVAGQGRKGEIVTVSDGYAHNFLLKGKKGVLATPEELKKLLESKVLNIPVKAGENGKLFGAITSKEIATQIKEELGLDIDKKKIEANIKNLGPDEIHIKLFTDVKAVMKVNVIAK